MGCDNTVLSSGRKRLYTVSFGGTVLATYCYRQDPSNQWTFLGRQTTAEGRVTEYATDDQSPSNVGFGTITHIKAPTGGITDIGYQLKEFFFELSNPKLSYAVTSITRGGHTWTYDYPGPSPSPPSQQPEFTVTVRADGQIVGTYTYYTYASGNPCDPNIWKVGTLSQSSESWDSTSRERTLSYDPFTFSNGAYYVPNCNQLPTIPRLTNETVTRDGFSLATTYSQYDGLKKAGKKSALLLVATSDGDMIFVALPLN
jgi:hypothetical protein